MMMKEAAGNYGAVWVCLWTPLRPPVLGGWDLSGCSVTQGHWGQHSVVEGRSFSAGVCVQGDLLSQTPEPA